MIACFERGPHNGGNCAHAARHSHTGFRMLESRQLLADLGGVRIAEPGVDVTGLLKSEALCTLLGGCEFKGRGLENRSCERRNAGDLQFADVDLLCCKTAVLFHGKSSRVV